MDVPHVSHNRNVCLLCFDISAHDGAVNAVLFSMGKLLKSVSHPV